MSIELEARRSPRKPTGGPEPLRRKRVQAAPASVSPNRRKLLNLLLAFVAGVLLIDALVGEKGVLEGVRAQREYADTEASLIRLRAENARLREDRRRFTEDRSAIEALAREELGYIRPGELVFIVRDVTPARTKR